MTTKNRFAKYSLLAVTALLVSATIVGCGGKTDESAHQGHMQHDQHQDAVQKKEELGDLGKVSNFTLESMENKKVSLDKDLEAKAKLVYFFFTNCGDVCPVTTARETTMQKDLKAKHVTPDEVKFVSITVDPKNDTPEAMKNYMTKFNVDPTNWYFLRGNEEETNAILKQFHIEVEQMTEHQISHNDRIFLVDENNTIRKSYPMEAYTNEEILKDVYKLIGK